ncbi:hypothetical protein QL285_064884 [Trifolium repens]|nr:hypothetical protein QL285_064884 [Trifolium repens]
MVMEKLVDIAHILHMEINKIFGSAGVRAMNVLWDLEALSLWIQRVFELSLFFPWLRWSPDVERVLSK